MWWDPPLYLHFFDRELGRSVGFRLTPEKAEFLLKGLLLSTTSQFYLGLSPVWESPAMSNEFLDLFSLLENTRAIDIVSNHPTIDEFLESRLALYRHDAKRYPMYFDALTKAKSQIIVPTQVKTTSATVELSKDLLSWAASDVSSVPRPILNQIILDLTQRESQAITYTYFVPHLDRLSASVEVRSILRRRISLGYTRHYKEYGTAELVTGVRGLEIFEPLSRRFPSFDMIVLEMVLRFIGYGDFLDRPWRSNEKFWAATPVWRGSGTHSRFRSELTLLLDCLCKCAEMEADSKEAKIFGLRAVILSQLRLAAAKVSEPRQRIAPSFERAISLTSMLISILRRDRHFAACLEKEAMARNEHACDVLLVVAADVERKTLLAKVKEQTGHAHSLRYGSRRTYYDLGNLGGARLVMAQCEMGSSTPGASQATVSDAIDELKPDAVVMVGIAFGVDSDKQQIGQILVSRQLQSYELQRVGTLKDGGVEIIPRGDRVTASIKLIGRFRAVESTWTGASVKFGLILSGEKLVDNIDFRSQLRRLEPEALGGEMEGAGLYAACSERKTDWIVVKAICDWGDGKKRVRKAARQKEAANQAVGFVLHTIAQGALARSS